MPELAHLMLSRRKELGTSCSSVLQNVGICLRSSHILSSLPLCAKVDFSVSNFFLRFFPLSCICFDLSVSHPLPITAVPTCLRDILSYFFLQIFVGYSWYWPSSSLASLTVSMVFLMVLHLQSTWFLSILAVHPCSFLTYIHHICILILFMFHFLC